MSSTVARTTRWSGTLPLVIALSSLACSPDGDSHAVRPAGRAHGVGGHDSPPDEPTSGARARTGSPSTAGPELPVDGARAMATLSEAESASVCAWLALNAPHRRVECEDGSTLEVGVGHDDGCPPAAAFAGCTLTVGETTACMAENARDPCARGPFGATVCAPFRECMLAQLGAVRDGPATEE